ncbi:MAG: alpha/beta hydrolase [Myxococcota bacterium]
MQTITTEMGGLTCRVVQAASEERAPDMAVVLCHGYGAPGEDLVPLAGEVLRHHPELSGRVRFYFPAAPLTLPGMPFFMDARAWWPIDVTRYERAMTDGTLDELRREIPEGLDDARRKLLALLDEVQRQTGLPTGRLVLGGFSQGAMLTTDVTLRLEEAPAALAIFSGTLLAEPEWRRRAPTRGGLRVLQTHGRQDPLLPFEGAVLLRDLLSDAGLEVEFHPFDGPHTIDAGGVLRLGRLLSDVLEG